MAKLIVVEARRLLPVAVLFLMLVAVSVYDGLSTPSVPVTTQPNSVPYRTLLETAQTRGIQAKVVTTLDMWVAMHEALGISLTDYDFQPDKEVAVFLLNCSLRGTKETEAGVVLSVSERAQTVQLVLFEKDNISMGGSNPDFTLVQLGKNK